MTASLAAPSGLDSFLTTVQGLFSSGMNLPLSSEGTGAGAPGQMTFGEISDYLSRSVDVLAKNTPANLINALETLDGAQHSLGVSVLLSACLRQQATLPDWESFSSRVIIFIYDCNADQIKYAPTCFAEMCHQFADALICRNCSIQGINPLIQAAKKLQPHQAALTSVHSDICKLSLSARCFGPALNLLKQIELTDVAKECNASNDAKYILLFFYYGGMILSAVKDFNEALYFFEVCITMPAVSVSHIMLEAHKKYLLVHLICQGHKSKEAMNLPKYTSSIVSKYFKQLSGPYNEVVNAFYSSKLAELQLAVARNSEAFVADQNMGLVKQVQKSQIKMIIKRLTKTFLTLSLEELANRVGLTSPIEAEKILVTMIQEGSIHATISQKDGMVRFDTAPADLYNSSQVLKMLEHNVNKCIQLDSKITRLDEEIVLNPNYIKKSNGSGHGHGHAGAGTGGAGGSGGTGLPTSHQNFDDEADGGAGSSSGSTFFDRVRGSSGIGSSGQMNSNNIGSSNGNVGNRNTGNGVGFIM